MSQKNLIIKNLHVSIDGKKILRGINLVVRPNKIIALMGPNGSGKSTLAHVLMGHPDYKVTRGQALWQGKNILKLEPHQRAKLGLFLAFQYPLEIPGVNLYEFLLTSFNSLYGKNKQVEFEKRLKLTLKSLKLSDKFLQRNINEGFSGGEKKKAEILQMKILGPKIAIMDETDSGLDIDALKLIARNSRKLVSPRLGILVITHYQRILSHLKPDLVYVMSEGKIVKSGKGDLAKQLEKKGYGWITKK